MTSPRGAASRILVTGAANVIGARLAGVLAGTPGVERVVGLDTRELPASIAGQVRHLALDLRDPGLGPALRREGIEAIVHNDVLQFSEPGRAARGLHDLNVVGTLQLLVTADGLPALRTLVVRGSAAIYGSAADAPDFWLEGLVGAGRMDWPKLDTRWQRDLAEIEQIVQTFARRHAGVRCSVLRLQPTVGGGLDDPVTRLVRAPVVPTVLGYDPRLQVLHLDDAVDALAAAVLTPVSGAVNVAPRGTVALSHALARLRRLALPVAGPLWGPALGVGTRLGLVPRLSEDMQRYLRFGRGVDTTRLEDELGFAPRCSTLEALGRTLAEQAPHRGSGA